MVILIIVVEQKTKKIVCGGGIFEIRFSKSNSSRILGNFHFIL